MQPKIFFIISLLLLLGCSSNKKSAVLIPTTESKIVVVDDTIVIEFSPEISNTEVMEETKIIFDSLVIDKKFSDDEIRRLNTLDSVSYRRITKIINGGYNGWSDRWKLYDKAKKALENYPDTIFK